MCLRVFRKFVNPTGVEDYLATPWYTVIISHMVWSCREYSNQSRKNRPLLRSVCVPLCTKLQKIFTYLPECTHVLRFQSEENLVIKSQLHTQTDQQQTQKSLQTWPAQTRIHNKNVHIQSFNQSSQRAVVMSEDKAATNNKYYYSSFKKWKKYYYSHRWYVIVIL